jgi:alkylation response protein AidB-like acyl-CoA dehydrogenase
MDKEFFHRDLRLFLERRVDWERYLRLRRPEPPNVADELATYESILGTLGEICEDIEAASRPRWHEEVRLVDGRVEVPAHIAAGYDKLRQAGLVCLPISAAYGGFGLPILINAGYLEMIARADASLMTIVGLQAGVAVDIERYGSEELKRRYLPRFASGELQGCMDLTEPQAGSDLGAIATRATEEGGRFFLDGGKIFITNGGADVHLVLSRDGANYDRSKGTTNGLSLMLCPVVLPDGTRNSVRVSRVEEKMGIHGSPTCAVEFDHAEAFLLGERGNGFRAMLDLMNGARLGVAAQAIGIGHAAYRRARLYAAERVQFGGPIIAQPLVKSMLTLCAIEIQSARTLLYRTCALVDLADALGEYLASDRDEPGLDRVALQEEHERSLQLIRFFTPLCKYYATEVATQVTRRGIQVHGGIGYMAESAAGHFHADSIITTIYEGTSEIQASFALREMAKGALFTVLEQTRTELESLTDRFPEEIALVKTGIDALTGSLPALMGDPSYALLNAKRVCDMVIDVVVSAELLFQATVDEDRSALASVFVRRQMLAVDMNAKRIQSGDASRLRRYDEILGL